MAAVHEGNERSEHVLGKCGFLRVGGVPFVGARVVTGEEEEGKDEKAETKESADDEREDREVLLVLF